MTLLDELLIIKTDQLTDTALCLRLAYEVIAELQEANAAQAALLMVSLDLPNVRQAVTVTVSRQDGD